MPRKKVTFGAQPKPNLDEWVETREVPASETPSEGAIAASPPTAVETKLPAPEPEKPEEPKEKIKRLTLDIPESLHRRIKGKAVMEGVTMVEMLRELLEETYG